MTSRVHVSTLVALPRLSRLRVTGHRSQVRFGWVATDKEHLMMAARYVASGRVGDGRIVGDRNVLAAAGRDLAPGPE